MAKEELLRSEIDDKYKWDLTKMYASDEEYRKDKNKLLSLSDELVSYKGKITKNGNSLYKFMNLEEQIDILITNLYVYASCLSDQDLSSDEGQRKLNEILDAMSKYNEKSSFVMPELMKTEYSLIKTYIEENNDLKEYEFDLEQIYRYQSHTLDDKEELLLSNVGELGSKFENNYSIAINSLVDYGVIKDEAGNSVALSNGNYSKYIRSNDRRVRKESFYARSNGLKKFSNLISTDYEASVRADVMIAKARKYDSTLQMHLYDDGVTEELYDKLLKVADDNIDVFHKYLKLIKNILKLDELEVYDLSAPLVKDDNKYTPDDAQKLISEALSVLGEEYVGIINKAFEERWIDFYPNKGKRGGYYQNDSFIGNPVILGNFNDDYLSVSSIAHELGHALHSYYSKKNNKPHLSESTQFVAEVVSLTNEMLLSNHIVKTSKDKNEKLIAINNILEVFSNNFYGTLSEGSIFEKEVHKRIYEGQTLTESSFNDIFLKIKARYYGEVVKKNELVKYGWSRVSHFYNPFYYYKYSIGVCGACYAARRIINGDKEYLEKYLKFLTLGGSMMPLDELKTIDLDFTNTKVIEEGIKYFSELIDEFNEVYNS